VGGLRQSPSHGSLPTINHRGESLNSNSGITTPLAMREQLQKLPHYRRVYGTDDKYSQLEKYIPGSNLSSEYAKDYLQSRLYPSVPKYPSKGNQALSKNIRERYLNQVGAQRVI
jgi:hypothetical protein